MLDQNKQIIEFKKNIVNFNNSYSSLPEIFYQRINPVPVKSPELIIFNKNLVMANCFGNIFGLLTFWVPKKKV